MKICPSCMSPLTHLDRHYCDTTYVCDKCKCIYDSVEHKKVLHMASQQYASAQPIDFISEWEDIRHCYSIKHNHRLEVSIYSDAGTWLVEFGSEGWDNIMVIARESTLSEAWDVAVKLLKESDADHS